MAKRTDRKKWAFERASSDRDHIPETSYLGDTGICLGHDYEFDQEDCRFVERACQTHDELVSSLERADKLIDVMAKYIGRMALSGDVLSDMNHHWIEVPKLLDRARAPAVVAAEEV